MLGNFFLPVARDRTSILLATYVNEPLSELFGVTAAVSKSNHERLAIPVVSFSPISLGEHSILLRQKSFSLTISTTGRSLCSSSKATLVFRTKKRTHLEVVA